MDISRRDSLAGLLVGGAAAGLAACDSERQQNKATPKRTDLPPLPKSPSSLLLNQVRAAQIMEQEKVDLVTVSYTHLTLPTKA